MDFSKWPAFRPKEVLSPDGLILWSKGIFPLRYEAMDFLQAFRGYIGVELRCNHLGHVKRGWRSPEENRLIYQESRRADQRHGLPVPKPSDNRFSFHTAGVAFDLSSPQISPVELIAKARSFGWVGLGLYDGFVHVDKRDGPPAFWNNSTLYKEFSFG